MAATGRAEGIIDCSAEDVAAWLSDYCSNERVRRSCEKGDPARLVLENNAAANEITGASVKAMPFPLKDREFVVKMIWKSIEAGVNIAFESVDTAVVVDYGTSFNTVRARSRGFYRIENLPDRGQVKQCRCTLYQNIDAGGIVPTRVMNLKLPYALSPVQQAIKEFRQDKKIDEADRAELAAFIREKHEDQEYSLEVRASFATVLTPKILSLMKLALLVAGARHHRPRASQVQWA